MAKNITVPGVGEFALPDDTTDAQIEKFVSRVSAAGSLEAAIAEQQRPGQGGIPIISPLLSDAVTGIAEIPTSVRGLFDKEGAEAWRQSYSQAVPEFFGMDPTKERTPTEMLAGGVGSLAPLLGASAITGGAATPLLAARLGVAGAGALQGTAAAARLASAVNRARMLGGAAAAVPLGMGTAQQMASAYEQRTGEKLTPGQYTAANIAGGAVGLFDLAPLQRWAEPVAKLLQKVPASKALEASKIVNNAKSRFLGKVAAGAAMEGGQEAVSQIAQNLIAAGIYDPEQSVTDSVAENFALGAGVGGIVETALLAAAGVKNRRNFAAGKQLEADVVKRQAEAGQGVTNLQGTATAESIRSLQGEEPITGQTIETSAIDLQNARDELDKAKADYNRIKSQKGLVNKKLKTIDIPYGEMSGETINDLGLRLGVKVNEGESLVDAISKKPKDKVLEAIVEQQIDVMKTRAENAQRRFDIVSAAGNLAPREAVTSSKFRMQYSPNATYSLGDVALNALYGNKAERPASDIRTAKEANQILSGIRKQKNIPGPRPDTSQMSDEELGEIVKAARVKTEVDEPPQYTVDQLSDNDLKRAMITLELNKVKNAVKDQKRFAIAEEQYDAQGNKIGEAVVRRHKDKASAERDIQSLNEAADPESYAKRLTPIANKVKSALSGMGLANVGVRFEKMLTSPDQFVEGAYDPEKKIISLVTGIYEPGMSEAQMESKILSVMNHEIIHAVKDLGLFKASEWNTLVRAAETKKLSGKLYTAMDWVSQLRPSLAADAASGNPEAVSLMQEEAVAEMFRNWMANGKKSEPASNLLSRILNFIKRIIGVARANKAEGIFADIASGRIGRRGRQQAPSETSMFPDLARRAQPTAAEQPVVAQQPTEATQVQPEEEAAPQPFAGGMYQPDEIYQRPIRKMRGKKKAPEAPVAPETIAPDTMSQPVEKIPFSFTVEGYGDKNIRLSSKVDLPQEADKAFRALARAQRSGDPEMYMEFAQNALRGYKSGPALTYAMEHVGDLTHRMGQYGNEYPHYEFGIEYVAPKVRTGLRVVTNPVDGEAIAKLPDDPTLKNYADAHAKLKVYNEAQRAARDAAVALGRKDLKEAERNLLILQEMIDNGTYVEIAGSYDPDYEGKGRKFSKVSFIDDNNKLVINPYPEGNVGTSTRYIRLGDDLVRKKGVKVKVDDIGKAFDAITENSDILDPAQRADIVNSIVDEINLQREQQNSGIGWYDSDVTLTFDILAKEFPEFKDPYIGEANRRMFTVIAGVMSNGMKAKDNVIHGAANYRFFLENDSFSPINPNSGKGWNQRSNIMGPQIQMLNNMYKSKRFAPRPGSNNPKIERMENFLEWMFSEHPVREINELRRESGIPSPAKIGKVDDLRLGMYAFGPKFGPFILNLNGRSDETVDSWASRSFYRHMGQAINQNGKMNDAPRTQAEREAMKAALRDVAQLSNLSSRDIQAVLWFYEKELYNKLGLRVPLEVFSDGAREYIRRIEDAGQGKPSQRGRAQPRESSAAGPKAGPSTARIKNPTTPEQRAEIEALVKKYPKYSAVEAPLSPSLEAAYNNTFTSVPKQTFFEKLTNFFTGNAGLRLVQGVFNKDQIVQYTEKSTFGQRQEAAMSATVAVEMSRRSSFVSGAAMFNGVAPVQFKTKGDIQSAYIRSANPDENVDAIAKFMAPIQQKGLNKQFALYGIARRQKAKPDATITDMTPQEVDEAIALDKQYPELKTAFEAYQRHNKNLIQMAVDSGRIEQGEANAMLSDLNYYGAYRVYEGELAAPKTGGNIGGGSTIARLSGQGKIKIMNDPIEMMIRNQTFWINASMKNIAAQKVANLAVSAGEAVKVKGDVPSGAMTMIAYENGKKQTYMFTSQRADLWYNSLRSTDRQDWGKAMNLLGIPADILRASVTHDPGFILANLFRDAFSTWGLRGEKALPWQTFSGYAEALKGSSAVNAMRAYGVGGGYDVAMKDPEVQAKILSGKLSKGVHTITDPIALTKTLWQKLENLSEASDAATRVAVFKKVMEETGDEYEAAYRALEVMNFTKQGGSAIVQGLSKIIPFFNAALQGKLVLGKAVSAAGKGISRGGFETLTDEERRLGKGMIYRGALMAAVATMFEMMNSDDEEYEDRVAPYQREQNFIISLKPFGMEGTFIKIPKPFEFGTMFATIPVSMYRWYSNENETSNDVAKTMVQQLASNFGITLLPPAITPIIEQYFNTDLYTGQPLVGRGKQGLDKSLQYNASTGEISKYLGNVKILYNFETGQWEGFPPIVIQNYIQSYGGPLGSYVLMAADYATSLGGVDNVSAATPISKYPVIRRFYLEAKDQNPVGADNMYNMISMLDEVNRTLAYYKKVGDAEGFRNYVKEKEPILRAAPTIKALKKVASDIRSMDTSVAENRTLSAEEKLKEVRRINDLEEKFLEDIRKLKIQLGL